MLKSATTLHDKLTDDEREVVQRWIAARYLQVTYPLRGRRRLDAKVSDFIGNIVRYIQWQLEQEPWRKLWPAK